MNNIDNLHKSLDMQQWLHCLKKSFFHSSLQLRENHRYIHLNNGLFHTSNEMSSSKLNIDEIIKITRELLKKPYQSEELFFLQKSYSMMLSGVQVRKHNPLYCLYYLLFGQFITRFTHARRGLGFVETSILLENELQTIIRIKQKTELSKLEELLKDHPQEQIAKLIPKWKEQIDQKLSTTNSEYLLSQIEYCLAYSQSEKLEVELNAFFDKLTINNNDNRSFEKFKNAATLSYVKFHSKIIENIKDIRKLNLEEDNRTLVENYQINQIRFKIFNDQLSFAHKLASQIDIIKKVCEKELTDLLKKKDLQQKKIIDKRSYDPCIEDCIDDIVNINAMSALDSLIDSTRKMKEFHFDLSQKNKVELKTDSFKATNTNLYDLFYNKLSSTDRDEFIENVKQSISDTESEL